MDWMVDRPSGKVRLMANWMSGKWKRKVMGNRILGSVEEGRS